MTKADIVANISEKLGMEKVMSRLLLKPSWMRLKLH